ncbi:unnamed protein product [Cylicocyclus nassatus]|uniref:Uncharacterized protein n=1 Tax=Cylicocyclus nassatus TaxID=53992 RepID=A0AA36GIE0_CYLNA|nr:unnamed protein product [Cylicocyclus nassatus]
MIPLLTVLLQLFDLLSAQLESSMGMQSNLDAPPKQLPQCSGEWQWPCRNGECIARYDVCDGIPQCSDGSDEWNCENWRARQNQYDGGLQGNVNRPVPTTQATPTTGAPEDSSTWLPTKEEFLILAAFAVLAVLIVMVIRRRARAKVLARNRRGNLLQADSDEDDILISSMYS